MTKPVRLQLSRRKGFNLQALSRATNGLEAVNVARPNKYGNPFLVHPNQRPGRKWACGYYTSVPTTEDAVECFRLMVTCEPKNPPPDSLLADLRANLQEELRGKNLACWCKLRDPCHADVLLELANAPICEAVE